MIPPKGELPQRQLALALRYAIDVARNHYNEVNLDKVRQLIKANPINVRARHVEHNLGSARVAWLIDRPSLGWKERRGTKRRAAEEGPRTGSRDQGDPEAGRRRPARGAGKGASTAPPAGGRGSHPATGRTR